ncbi:MAG TPA: hypothetical protein VMW17_12285 [Candidatus Binatia bacterium]|nr:hypothetical protein [Candidatus Binatia bacterium]
MATSKARGLILGCAVVVFAAGVRTWQLADLPRAVHKDEMSVSLAERLWHDPDCDWLAPFSGYSVSNLCIGVAGAGGLVFGVNPLGARASGAVLGTLSVALLYDGLRVAAGPAMAVLASVLLAANHTHIAFSRVASSYIQPAFVVSFIWALFARLWIRPTYFAAALLGIGLAVATNLYQPALAALPLLGVSTSWLLLMRPERRRGLILAGTIVGVSFVSACAIVAVESWKHREQYAARSSDICVLSEHLMTGLKRDLYHTDSALVVVAEQAWVGLRGFHFGRDKESQYAINHPLTDAYSAALMIPGLTLALLSVRQFTAVNAVIFTFGYLVIALGMFVAEGFNRTTGALPLAMILPAIAIVQCCAALFDGSGWLSRAARVLTMAAIASVSITANLLIYFRDYAPMRTTIAAENDSEAGRVARMYASQYTIHLVSWPLPIHEGLQVIVGDLPVRRPAISDPIAYVKSAAVSGSDLFIIGGADTATRDALLARFPTARLEPYRPNTVLSLSLVFVGSPRTQVGRELDRQLSEN